MLRGPDAPVYIPAEGVESATESAASAGGKWVGKKRPAPETPSAADALNFTLTGFEDRESPEWHSWP